MTNVIKPYSAHEISQMPAFPCIEKARFLATISPPSPVPPPEVGPEDVRRAREVFIQPPNERGNEWTLGLRRVLEDFASRRAASPTSEPRPGELFGLPGDGYGYAEVESVVGYIVRSTKGREWLVRRAVINMQPTWEADSLRESPASPSPASAPGEDTP